MGATCWSGCVGAEVREFNTLRGEVTLSPAAEGGRRSSYLSESLRVFNPRATDSSRAVYRTGSFSFI